QWEQLCGCFDSQPFMSLGFLTAFERTALEANRLWYVVVQDGLGRPQGCACLSRVSLDMLVISGDAVKSAVRVIRAAVPSFLYVEVLMCGLPFSAGIKHLVWHPEADGISVLRAIDEAMQAIAQRERIRFLLYKEFHPQDRAVMDGLLQLGYVAGDSLPGNLFHAEFSSFDEYCSALKAHYRQDIRRSKRKFDSRGYRVKCLTDSQSIAAAYTDTVHRLYETKARNAAHSMEVLPALFFMELASELEGTVSLTCVYQEDEIVAFNWALHAANDYYFLFCGIDEERNRSGDLYFNLMYQEMDNALKRKVRNIHFGQTADTFKARLGCVPVPLYVYVKGLGAFPSRFVSRFSGFLFGKRLHRPSFRTLR
ncbi:MAG: GNAT family N-acetyltransferase, partial [Acidobacteriota bacterium]|nr:GNAT family N-acetyltransferase [Acidobacteriota bacterium]